MTTLFSKILGISLLACHLPSFAIKPVQGWYAGVFLGPTYTPSIDFFWNPANFNAQATNQIDALQKQIAQLLISNPTAQSAEILAAINSGEVQTALYTQGDHSGKLTYSVLGGIGGQIGYRFCEKFRFEIEALYNNNPFNELKFDGFTVNSVSTNPYFHIGGDTNTGAGMFNFYYDFLTHSNDTYSAIAPYIGVGLGYAFVQNSLQFHYGYDPAAAAAGTPATKYEIDFTKQYSTYAGQVILGVSYFMDDFCWLSADVRYWTTGKLSTTIPLIDQQFQRKEQLYSAMIGFNGILDFG